MILNVTARAALQGATRAGANVGANIANKGLGSVRGTFVNVSSAQTPASRLLKPSSLADATAKTRLTTIGQALKPAPRVGLEKVSHDLAKEMPKQLAKQLSKQAISPLKLKELQKSGHSMASKVADAFVQSTKGVSKSAAKAGIAKAAIGKVATGLIGSFLTAPIAQSPEVQAHIQEKLGVSCQDLSAGLREFAGSSDVSDAEVHDTDASLGRAEISSMFNSFADAIDDLQHTIDQEGPSTKVLENLGELGITFTQALTSGRSSRAAVESLASSALGSQIDQSVGDQANDVLKSIKEVLVNTATGCAVASPVSGLSVGGVMASLIENASSTLASKAIDTATSNLEKHGVDLNKVQDFVVQTWLDNTGFEASNQAPITVK